MNIEVRFGRKEANQMKSKYSFISTASGVFLSLTVLVAEAASPETPLVSTIVPRQDSKVPANTPATASLPLQAKVIDCVGKVRWRTGSDIAWKDAKDAAINDLLSAGAEVRTGLRSRMTLKFDNATILIDSNSNFAMPTSELVKESDGDVYRTVAQMKSGRGDFQVDKVGAKNDFKVVTPSSTLAVRGTGFSVTTGAMTGTEVAGARTNAIAAIQLKYAATNQVVQMSGGGDSKSSSSSPEPASSALMSSIGALPMVGTATSAAEHASSASMGTTQTPVQVQNGAMVTTVSQAVVEATGGGDAAENGNSAGAIFADIRHADDSLNRATLASQGAGAQLQLAIVALAKAQTELVNAQFHAQAARDARDDVAEAAESVAQQLVLVNEALTESGEARSSALENARQSLEMFAMQVVGDESGQGGLLSQYGQGGEGNEIRQLADAAIDEADRARLAADDALSGSSLVVDFSESALERLDEAFASKSNSQSAANRADSAALEGSAAAASAREFLALVKIARDEIATIYARRPLSGIEASLNAALLRLELSSQAVLLAENARDVALTAALAAQADAQNTVLEAAQAAALAAAQDALAAFTASSAADAAAIDAQTGMGKLDLAIDAMLNARDEASVALSTSEAAQAFRDIAQARRDEAQAQIEIHSDAAIVANDAQLDAAQALVEALGHLDSAIANSGFTTDAVAACFAALEAQNQAEAEDAALAARGFANDTLDNAENANDSAESANDASNVAESQVSVSEDAFESYADRLEAIRVALANAVASAAESASAAVGSSDAAGAAQTAGNAFASQFSGSDAAQAALLAVERALTLAADAGEYAQTAADARDDAASALADVTDEEGESLDFSSTSASADLAATNAGEANDAAIEAARLAAVADAEAATAETAVGTLDGLIGAQITLTNSQNLFVNLSEKATHASGMLEQVQNFVDQAEQRVETTQSAAVAGETAVINIEGLLEELHLNLDTLLVALNNEDIDGANEITNGWEALGVQANNVLLGATEASSSATSTATHYGWQGAIDATQSLEDGIASDAQSVSDLSQQVAIVAQEGASYADDAATMADLSHQFAYAAINGGSLQSAMVGAVANAASNLALLAAIAADDANEIATEATDVSSNLANLISVTDFQAVINARQVALANAQRALQALESVQGSYVLGSAESNAAIEAIQTLVNKIETDSAATNVEFQGVSVAGYADQINSAITVHEGALEGVQGARDGALEALASAQAGRTEAMLQDTNVFDSFGQMLQALGSGDATLAISFSQTASEQAGFAIDSAEAAASARDDAVDQRNAAVAFATTSQTQAQLAQSALDAATGLLPDINLNTDLAQQRAEDSQVSAGFSQDAATLAGSGIAQALADRALALSVLALDRASAAIAARETALYQIAMGSSAIQQASFQQSTNLAGQANQFASDAITAASEAQFFADNAENYANLAQSSAGAFLASADAFAFRVDADVALGNTIFARDTASQAIGVHNEALTTVSSLFASAGVSLTETQNQRNLAVDFSNDAHTFFLATTYQDFTNASNADASATQSEFSASASDSSAIETRGYANEALLQAAISQQAGSDYSNALDQANAFAAVGGTASAGATNSAAQALAFSQAATNFAAAIGSAQANIARDFALAARDQAIVQRSGALASRDAALAAAESARSMGERVFFTRTAEIAADTVARADQARIFADQAIQAATNARTDATNAIVVANGGSGQAIPPSN